MYLQYGSYVHAFNEAGFKTHQTQLKGQDGLAYGVTEVWDIRGFIQGATTPLLLAAMNTMEVAYQPNFKTIRLIANDGVTILRQMVGSTRLGGTEVTQAPSFPEDGVGTAEFTTYRNYTIQVTGTYPLPVGGNPIVEWEERLDFSGGGPLYAHSAPVTGFPGKQGVIQNLPYRCQQSGKCVSLYYPWHQAASMLFPGAHKGDPHVTYEAPKTSWNAGTRVYTMFPTTWVYTFEDANPLNGFPHLWP